MNEPTEGELYKIKCAVLAQDVSNKLNEITNLQWIIQTQTAEIESLKEAASVSQEATPQS